MQNDAPKRAEVGSNLVSNLFARHLTQRRPCPSLLTQLHHGFVGVLYVMIEPSHRLGTFFVCLTEVGG